jgi:hypothetical protein
MFRNREISGMAAEEFQQTATRTASFQAIQPVAGSGHTIYGNYKEMILANSKFSDC